MVAQEILWAASAAAFLVALLCFAAERRPDLHGFAGVPWPLLMILALVAGLGLALGASGVVPFLSAYPHVPRRF